MTYEEIKSMPLTDYLDAAGCDYIVSGDSVTNVVRLSDGHPMSSFSYSVSKNLWSYFAQGLHGVGVFSYVMKVEGIPKERVMEHINNVMHGHDRGGSRQDEVRRQRELAQLVRPKVFTLPPASPTINQLMNCYHNERCIDRDIIQALVDKQIIYESNEPYIVDGQIVSYIHNAVFVARDSAGVPRAAAFKALQGSSDEETGKVSYFGGDVVLSDKQNCLTGYFPAEPARNSMLVLFESFTDAMSYLTLQKRRGRDWTAYAVASLGGVAATYSSVPHSLSTFLSARPYIDSLVFAFDNDATGAAAALSLSGLLKSRYAVHTLLPERKPCYYSHCSGGYTKDWNDICIEEVKTDRVASWKGRLAE